MLTLDENDKLVGWIFIDNREQYFLTFKGELEGSKLKLKLKLKGKKDTYDETIEYKDGKLIRVDYMKDKAEGLLKIVAVYTRRN